MLEDVFLPIAIVGLIFVGMPWVFLHYMTQWKRSRGLSIEDEKLLDDMHETARKLDDRLNSIERIMTADNPAWREERFTASAAEVTKPFDRRH